jgi:hypothetical protein
MHPIFHIKSADVKALTDVQARELVARLCKAELLSKGAGTDAVTWGGDQRAKDGGVDVRVDIVPAIGIGGYVPSDATLYQVKAETFGKAKIPGEMAPRGTLRRSIVEIAEKSGAYVIVSTRDNLSDLSLEERRKAMSVCLAEHGLAGKVHLDFYDARRVADWVENHPSIAIWIRAELGRPLIGWRPYEPWAYREDNVEDDYLIDDKVKVFAPDSDQGIDAIFAIKRLRADIQKAGSSTRIVGLSGVGKTRLAQALFDPKAGDPNAALDRSMVLYTDLSDEPNLQPSMMLNTLLREPSRSIVIVDNCGQDTHRKLTDAVTKAGSKVSLLTIEYDIRDDLPENTNCYRLEGSSNDLVRKVLRRRYEKLSDLDIDKIVELSDGNSRVAFALASTSETKGELAQLRDAELFQRLFVQKNTESDELQRCAEVASLLYSFNVIDDSAKSELAILSSIADVSVNTFLRNIVQLQRRGLVQARGKWRAILPHAISNRLALKAMESYPQHCLVKKLVDDAPSRVARSFSRRISYLHESDRARGIASAWLQVDGFLGNVACLDEAQRQILRNVAPISQRAALSAIERCISDENFTSVLNKGRAEFGRLLRSLAYDQALFQDAATALMMFALQEPPDYRMDSVREMIKSLFYSHLSGTQALPAQRGAFIRGLLLSNHAAKQKLALTLLEAGLESNYFTSHYSFDFGASQRNYGWSPRTLADVENWYGLMVGIVVELGKTPSEIGADARQLLGASFRGLWVKAGVKQNLIAAADELAAIDGWPDGWIAIRTTLNWDKEKIDVASLEELKELERQLAPRDLIATIRAKVLSRGAFSVDVDEDLGIDCDSQSASASYRRAQEAAERLGKLAALDEQALSDLKPFLTMDKSTEKSWHFGHGVGLSARSVVKIMDRIKPIISGLRVGEFNSLFVRGIVSGWNEVHPTETSLFLDAALVDETWGAILPELQVAVGIDDAAYNRLLLSLKSSRAPSWQFQYVGTGRATDALTVEQIGTLITLLFEKADKGPQVAVDLLNMVRHCAAEKTVEYQEELRRYCADAISTLD